MADAAHEISVIATQIESALQPADSGAFGWHGQKCGELPASTWDAMGHATRLDYRVAFLANHLYPHMYCYGQIVVDLAEMPVRDEGMRDLTAAQADLAHVRVVDPSWTVVSVDDLGAVAVRGHTRARFSPDALTEVDGEPRVLVGAAEPSLSPGFSMVRGRRDLDASGPTYRFYFSLTPAGRADCQRHLISTLDEANVRFRFKAVSRPGFPHRADAAVLYVGESSVEFAISTIEERLDAWEPWTVPVVPTFSLAVAPGIGFAQDPGDGQSFGESRCQAVARASCAWLDSGANAGDLADRVRHEFEEAGIDPVRVHLNKGGTDITSRAAAGHRRTQVASRIDWSVSPKSLAHDDLLEVARAAGDACVEAAIRSGDRCQWIATRPGGPALAGPAAGTLAANLYGGLAGVALFLIRLGLALDVDKYLDCGIGAANTALSITDAEVASGGLYTGSAGVLAVLGELAAELGESALASRVETLVEQHLDEPLLSGEPDMLVGWAGELVALLRLAKSSPHAASACLARAEILGHQLVETAVPLGDGVGWTVRTEAAPKTLAGFTHGGAGIIYALLSLHRHRPSDAIIDSVRAAIIGEDSMYRPIESNWLDLRSSGHREQFSFYWCHGLPGVLLSRAAAADVLPDDATLSASVRAATSELAGRLRRAHPLDQDLGLCHGLCGNAEILDLVDPSHRDWIRALYDEVARVRGPDVATWPIGRGEGQNPGLFTGYTGVALSYLRFGLGSSESILRP